MVDEVTAARERRIRERKERMESEDRAWQCGECEGMRFYLNDDGTIECADCGMLPAMEWRWIEPGEGG